MLPTPPGLDAALADRYTLHSVLGSGGTSTVYRARDEKHGRDVAIKVLRPELVASLTRQRFAREAEIVAKLQHPHILSLIESGSAADTFYFVMPLVEGSTLRDRLGQDTALSVGEVTRILADLADALAYAHEQGVVHRDIKPSNVLLTGRHALLMDFGVAKGLVDERDAQLTVGIALGTPSYMSPEQAMALPTVDHRADIYALGVLGYELLAGQPPFFGGSPQDVLAAHVSRTPEDLKVLRPDVPDALCEIVMRCLEKAPEARWSDAKAVVAELDALVTPSGGVTPVSGTPAQGATAWWKGPWAAMPAVALVLVGVVLLGRGGPEAGAVRVDRERLTFAGDVIESAISSDGEWLAYVTSNAADQKLYVRDLNATTVLELDRAQEIGGLVWSEDGSEIAYHSGPADPTLRAMPRLGGAARVLGRGHVLPSPDLSRVVHLTVVGNTLGLVDLALGDTVWYTAPSWVRDVNRAAWAPDSRRIAFQAWDVNASDYAIFLTLTDGSLVEAIRDSAQLSDPSFSRDGTFLYFLRQPPGELPDLMRSPLGPDGRLLGTPQLVLQDFDGDLWERFSNSDHLNRFTHTDNNEIVYVPIEGESNVWAFDIGEPGAEPRRITSGAAVHSRIRTSPDGGRLAMVRTTRLAKMVGVMPPGGGPLQPIATSSREEVGVSWSATGAKLAMTVREPGAERQIAVHDFGSGTTRVLETETVGFGVAWAGDRLIVQAPDRHDFWIVDPESGSFQIAVEGSVGFNFFPRVSPDGNSVAYFKRRNSRSGQSGVWLKNIGSDQPERPLLLGEVSPIGFDETGERLFAADNGLINRPQRVLEVMLATGDVRTLATLPPDYLIQEITQDGNEVFATQRQWRGDVWRLTPSTN